MPERGNVSAVVIPMFLDARLPNRLAGSRLQPLLRVEDLRAEWSLDHRPASVGAPLEGTHHSRHHRAMVKVLLQARPDLYTNRLGRDKQSGRCRR